MSGANTGVLFLCVGNSARSQMAEGFASALAPAGVSVYSAGSAPATLHPLAVEVMREIGIDISDHRSKSVADIPGAAVGTVVTLCAEEICPVFPGDMRRHHWPFPDPAAAPGSREHRLRSFREVRDGIRKKVAALFSGGPTAPDPQRCEP